MFHIFNFLQSGMVFEIVNPFSCISKAISSEKSCLVNLTSGQLRFSRLLNPDVSFQISRAPAVCRGPR